MTTLALNIPYPEPRTPDQLAANNTNALVFYRDNNLAPSVADQVKRHIELVHTHKPTVMHFYTVY